MANIIFSPPKDESELPQHSALYTGKLMLHLILGCSILDVPSEIRKKEPSILISNLNNNMSNLADHIQAPSNCAHWCVVASHHPFWSDVVGHAII